MSPETSSLQAESLRRQFDSTFARATSVETPPTVDLLSIRVGDRRYAIDVTEISGLVTVKTLTPLPGSTTVLLGITGFRGSIIPVYDLAALLGHEKGETFRWLVVTAGITTTGLAFDGFEGHLRVEQALVAAESPKTPGAATRQVLHRGDETVPIIGIKAVVEKITGQTNQSKER